MTVKIFRKIAVEVPAIEWTGKNLEQVKAFLGDSFLGHIAERRVGGRNEIKVGTLEDGELVQVEHVASLGDYLLRGVKGEFYPCKPDIMKLTYEEVE